MSLNFKQCKDVVEKVWGFDWDLWRVGYAKEAKGAGFESMLEEWTTVKVSSWEGFGKTVEAMEKRGYLLSVSFDELIFSRPIEPGRYKVKKIISEDEGLFNAEMLGNRFHLAALEAIKQEDEG